MKNTEIIGCILITCVKVTFGEEDKKCYFAAESEEKFCLCEEGEWSSTPIITHECRQLTIIDAELQNVGKSWFMESRTYKKLKILKLHKTVITHKDDLFFRNLGNLEYVEVLESKAPFLETTLWPFPIKTINITDTNLTKFVIKEQINLYELRLRKNNLKIFPKLLHKVPLKILNLNGNEDIKVTYENLVPFCELEEVRINKLWGTNSKNPTNSTEGFCECVRIKQWIKHNKFYSDIKNCTIKQTGNKTFTEKNCTLSYVIGSYTQYDQCGRILPGKSDDKTFLFFIMGSFLFLILVVAAALYFLFITMDQNYEENGEEVKEEELLTE